MDELLIRVSYYFDDGHVEVEHFINRDDASVSVEGQKGKAVYRVMVEEYKLLMRTAFDFPVWEEG